MQVYFKKMDEEGQKSEIKFRELFAQIRVWKFRKIPFLTFLENFSKILEK